MANSLVNISDKEKTIVDALDRPRCCGGMPEVAKCLWNARRVISWDKLVEYALRMGNNTILRRLGYLSELLDIKVPEHLMLRMKSNLGKGYSALDPTMPVTGVRIAKWCLLVNISEKSLLQSRRG